MSKKKAKVIDEIITKRKEFSYYVDNYRGFLDEYINIENVTFLVGENSSGKSSIIKAIHILSDYSLWMNGYFVNDNLGFDRFDDILAANHTRHYFSLGVFEKETRSLDIFSFDNKNGSPHLFREIIYNNEILLCVNFNEKDQINIAYKKSFNLDFTKDSFIKDLLDLFEKKLSKDFTTKNIKQIPGEMPLAFVKSLIREECKEISKVFEEERFLLTTKSRDVTYVDPIRAKPQPLYFGSQKKYTTDGFHVPYLLKSLIEKKSPIIKLLQEFGKNSGLFDDIESFIYEGKGRDNSLSPFEILIKKGEKSFKISSVGYGVSQILPILVDLLVFDKEIIMIQQPEVHLHPKAQAAFGDFLYQITLNNKKRRFIIETHSDYLIDRFRYACNKAEDKISSEILFTKNDGFNNAIQTIPINLDGKYADVDMADYRDFFLTESFKLMEI